MKRTARSLSALLPSAAVLALAAAPLARAERMAATEFADLTDGAGGTVTGSGNYLKGSSDYGHANAFDNAYGNDNSRVIFSSAAGWVAYAFPSATVVDAFTVRVPKWNVGTRSPKRFTLSGSNDGGATWTVLDEETDQTGWSAQEIRAYGFDNETPYLAYKFEVLEDNGEGNAQFSELQLARRADARMLAFVWQPAGVAAGSWTNDAVWVGAAALSSNVPHWPTAEATVSFAGVETPDVVVEIDGWSSCKGLDFSGSAGLTNLALRAAGPDAVLQYSGLAADIVWPASETATVALEGVRLLWSGNVVAGISATGTLVLRDGAFIDAWRKWSLGSSGTPFHMRLEGSSRAELASFGLAAGTTLEVDDSTFYPRAMNLSWQGAATPGSVRFAGAAPLLKAERLLLSAEGKTGDVAFDVPAAGWAAAPVQQIEAVYKSYARELVEPLSDGAGTLRFSVDPASGFYTGARRPQPVPIALWESGIRADRIELAPLRNGSSWRWGYGEGGALAEPAAAGDLPTALWADLVPNNRPTVVVVR